MSLDDLLPLLFVAVFVVNAVMRGRRARRGRSGRNRPDPKRPTPSAPTAETREAPRPEPPRPSPAASGDEAGGTSPADDLRRRIEEAQRRVREAMEDDGSDARGAPRADTSRPDPTPPAPSRPEAPVGPPDAGRPAAPGPSARPPAPATVPSLGREGLPPGRTAAPPGPGSLGREGTPPRRPDRVPVGDDEGPRVTRLGEGSSSARLRAARDLGKDRDDIVRGFVWAMVLERPVALRMRRSSSPRRSR